MSKAADRCAENVIHEYRACAQALNMREQMDALDELIGWAVDERNSVRRMFDEIEWAGTAPMGGQD